MSPKAPQKTQKAPKPICSICGKPSEKAICGACADKIRAEALARKKQQEKKY